MINNIKYLIISIIIMGCNIPHKIDSVDASVELIKEELKDDQTSINQCIDDNLKYCDQSFFISCEKQYCIYVRNSNLVCN